MRTRRAVIFDAPFPKPHHRKNSRIEESDRWKSSNVFGRRNPSTGGVMYNFTALNDPKTRKRYKICAFVYFLAPRWTPLGRCNTWINLWTGCKNELDWLSVGEKTTKIPHIVLPCYKYANSVQSSGVGAFRRVGWGKYKNTKPACAVNTVGFCTSVWRKLKSYIIPSSRRRQRYVIYPGMGIYILPFLHVAAFARLLISAYSRCIALSLPSPSRSFRGGKTNVLFNSVHTSGDFGAAVRPPFDFRIMYYFSSAFVFRPSSRHTPVPFCF